MERLTEWYDDGEYKGVMAKEQFGNQVLKTLFEEWDEGYVGMCQLKVYEDTGLTPPEIMKLKERDTEKAPKICKNKYSDTYTCPNCALALVRKGETGWFCGKHYTYCPDCGQRLKWEV